MEKTMDKIVALAKSRGFVYPGSEIYGGLANTWDYGNLGVELKNNVKRAWWQKFIQESPYNVGVDCAILMNPQTWVASGHLGGFSDPLMDCKECHERFRADKIIEDYSQEHGIELESSVDGWSQEEMKNFIEEHNVPCPTCGKHNFTDIRQFNLMFKTFQGVTEDAKNTVYLRPETAQGIFVNFKNVQRTSRKKIPFGIGQIGKSFRNEITPGNFTFRTREFEQMELEFFCEPDTDLEWFAYWKQFCIDWLQTLGIKPEEMRVRDHEKELRQIVLNINLDMIGTYMGKFIACVSAEEKLTHYISYMAAEVGFPIAAENGVYSSDSTPFADHGVPAVSFARIASGNVAPIHCRYDVKDVMSMEQLQKDIDFLAAFTGRFANAAVCPVAREIPETIRKQLDEYLFRKRKEA